MADTQDSRSTRSTVAIAMPQPLLQVQGERTAVLEVSACPPPQRTRLPTEPAIIRPPAQPDYPHLLHKLRENRWYDVAFSWVDCDEFLWYHTVKETYDFVKRYPVDPDPDSDEDMDYETLMNRCRQATCMEHQAVNGGTSTEPRHFPALPPE